VPSHRSREFLVRWVPVLVWMTLIFVASADPESGPRGSRLLGPVIRWFVPDIGPEAFERTVLVARKLVHFGTFGVLAALFWRALAAAHPGRWRGSTAALALAATVAYAISDEIHQAFVPTRVGSPMDVAIDTAGAVFALAGLRCIDRLRSGR
jgi:VanZ family protein